MIRINLIGLKTKRAKPTKLGGKGQLLLFAAIIVVEVVFLFLWHQQLNAELDEAKKRTRDATAKIEDLKRVKVAWEVWLAEKADIEAQEQVFDRLRADQLGPPAMLEYVTYALTPLADSPAGSDEARAQELIGWNPKWDTRRIWLKSVREDAGKLTFQGEAVDHEDVAEFYRRLEASGFFFDVEPGSQTRKVHIDLGVKYVDFDVSMGLSYLAVLEPAQPADGEVPALPPDSPLEPPAPSPAPAPQPGHQDAPPGPPSGPGVPVGPGAPVVRSTPDVLPTFAWHRGDAGAGR